MNKLNAIVAAVCLALGFGLGSQLMPKIESKVVEVEKEVIRNNVVTQTKIITRPDGSKEEVTVTTDKSIQNKESKSTSVIMAKLDWHASAAVLADPLNMKELTYSLTVERRILGDVYLGITANTKKNIGLTAGFSF